MISFSNLKVSKSFNFLIENYEPNYSKISKNMDLLNFPYAIILNHLILFLYKKLTPFLFQEVKNYLDTEFTKCKNGTIKNAYQNKSLHELFFILNNKSKNKINNISSQKRQTENPLRERKKTNYQIGKKVYIPKSEHKKNHSSYQKCNIFENTQKKINISYANRKKDKNEMESIKTQYIKNSKNKINSKRKKDHSFNNSKNNSISNSKKKFNTNSYNYKNDKNKKNSSNIFYTNRKHNNNKNYLLNKKNKIHSSSKKRNHLTKSHPLLNEKILYQLSFNNICNFENNNKNNNLYYNKNYGNYSLKKNINKMPLFQNNYEPNYCNKNIKMEQKNIIQNPLINIIKSKNYSNKSNSYSALNNNIVFNAQKKNFNNINLESYYEGIINGGENKKNLNQEKNDIRQNNNNEEKRNSINRKSKLLNEEMMKKIKNTVDDNLKIMLNFSYENFLSKESEQESKEYYLEKSRNLEERNNTCENYN